MNDTGSFEIVKLPYEPYAFSVKRIINPITVTHESYIPIIELFQKHGTIKAIEYENDSRGTPHIHGILILPKGFFRKKLCPKGFHIKLEYMYDEVRWLRYIRKDRQDIPDASSKSYGGLYLFESDYKVPCDSRA